MIRAWWPSNTAQRHQLRSGNVRGQGDVLEIFPSNSNEKAIRVEFFGDEIERISEIEVVTGNVLNILGHTAIFSCHPLCHQPGAAVVRHGKHRTGFGSSEPGAARQEDKLLEAQRLVQRTEYDLEMMREIGFCPGIENYSRYFDGRKPGDPPYTPFGLFPQRIT